MMTYKRGDIVLVQFPNSNFQSYKKRPVVIVQADDLDTGIPQKIVAMITSNLNRISGQSRVFVAKNSVNGENMGIISDSVIVADNLATVLEREIYKVIGQISDIEVLNQALRKVLDL